MLVYRGSTVITNVLNYCITSTEDIIVLRANIVAQSFTVDWLSKAPCVSMSNTVTCEHNEIIILLLHDKLVSIFFCYKNRDLVKKNN